MRAAVFQLAARGAALSALYHRARLLGGEHLPRSGPVLLVGNHGVWGYETPAFFHLLHHATGRHPLGLAERGFFRIPLIRTVLPWLGGVEGTRDKALEVLRAGALVVCYPGGALEVFKRPPGRYQLRWEQALGFARLAARAGVPVVPFAGFGVDDTFVWPPGEARLGLRLKEGDRYRVPLMVGLGPLPLPVKLTFAVAPAQEPPPPDASESRLTEWRERVAASVRLMMVRARNA
ncbi:acyltransferase family protein [Myxococcus sp. K15C18031901]|uniref:lysophospholipid acyltransferase family protein n=1 Tax=Myxococcus dinghuensis TaxID=2906761 RepID=UPI0020A701BE|nr:1-acyl-sn-glycerol-3-phosphate acyltransferase [Myxococcus dinghuensis]MCP3103067.1 acyltransferase family protein [Myxococcus dinghuensis]